MQQLAMALVRVLGDFQLQRGSAGHSIDGPGTARRAPRGWSRYRPRLCRDRSTARRQAGRSPRAVVLLDDQARLLLRRAGCVDDITAPSGVEIRVVELGALSRRRSPRSRGSRAARSVGRACCLWKSFTRSCVRRGPCSACFERPQADLMSLALRRFLAVVDVPRGFPQVYRQAAARGSETLHAATATALFALSNAASYTTPALHRGDVAIRSSCVSDLRRSGWSRVAHACISQPWFMAPVMPNAVLEVIKRPDWM